MKPLVATLFCLFWSVGALAATPASDPDARAAAT